MTIRITTLIEGAGDDDEHAMHVRLMMESDGGFDQKEAELAKAVSHIIDEFTDAAMQGYADPGLLAIVGPYIPLGRLSFWLSRLQAWLKTKISQRKSEKIDVYPVNDFLDDLDFENFRLKK